MSVRSVRAVTGASIRVHGHSRPVVGHYERRWPSPQVISGTEHGTDRAHARNARCRQALRVASNGSTDTTSGGRSRSSGRSYSVGANLSLVPRASSSEGVHGDIFINMHSLGMLPKVVQSRKSARAVTLERALSGVLPDVSSKMFASRETEIARRVVCAVKSLRLLLLVRPGTVGVHAIIVGAGLFFDAGLSADHEGVGRACRGSFHLDVFATRLSRSFSLDQLGAARRGVRYLNSLGER